jgi:phosphoserine phosphatase RsbU/P
MNSNDKNNQEPKLFDTLKDDLQKGNFRNDLSTDYSELKEFFLNTERKNRLAGMGKIKRFFVMFWWLLKELLLKLNPTRRLILLIGIILLVSVGRFGVNGDNVNFSSDTSVFGGIIILFILMLELKDKLLAKDELNAGKSVQVALMSERNPKVNGWNIWLFTQPANDVGGDLVDFVKLGNNQFGITLADVSGKGLGAALLMAKLQTIIRAFAPDLAELSSFGEKINKVFHKDILPNSFASMVYLKIEENCGDVEILNAGHLPPLHIKGNQIIELSKGNVALGLSNNSKYNTEKLVMEDSDYLLIYSDGVSEASNLNMEFYGVDRLKNFLKSTTYSSPEILGQRLLNHIYHFIGENKRSDDLSIVILQKTK